MQSPSRMILTGLGSLLAVLAAPSPLLAHARSCDLIYHTRQPSEWFGFALAADGGRSLGETRRLAVGAPGDPNNSARSKEPGAAYVFRGDSTGWSQEAQIRGVALGDRFGTSVALFDERLAVGAPAANGELAQGAGAVYLFSRNGSPEIPARVTAPNGHQGDQFGAAVALGADTLVVGAPGDGERGSLAGAAYVFQRSGTGWGQPQKLLADAAQPAAQFGSAVAIAGNTVVVGAPYEDYLNRRNLGAVYVFERTGGTWGFVQKLTVPFVENDVQFGAAVAIDAIDAIDGNSLAVGARGKDREKDDNAGAVYRFTHTESGWTQDPSDPLLPQDPVTKDDQLGTAVAIAGNKVVAGAPFHKVDGEQRGAAFVFVGGVDQEPPFSGLNASVGSQFGASVAVSGNTVLVGGPRDDPKGTVDAGSVAFCGPSQPCNQLPTITKTGPAGAVGPGPEISYTVVVANDSTTALPAARVTDLFDPRLDHVLWCRADGDGACTPVSQPGRDIAEVLPLPGNSRVTWRAKASLRNGSTGELPNRACVSVPDCPDLGERCSTVRNPIGVDLRVTLVEVDPAVSVVKGREVKFRWRVENVGNTPATKVKLTFMPPSPPGLDLVSSSPCVLSAAGVCDLDLISLPADVVLTYRVPACYTGPSPLAVPSADVASHEREIHPDDNHADGRPGPRVQNGEADVTVLKQVFKAKVVLPQGARVQPGEPLTYRITVDNLGQDTACGVVLTDCFPAGLIPAVPSFPDPSCSVEGQCSICRFDELKKDDPPRVLKADFMVRRPVASCPFPIPNTATVSTQGSNDPTPNDSSTAVITVDEVDFAISKEGPATATACAPPLYTIHVSNQSCHDVPGEEVRVSGFFFPPDVLQAKWCRGAGCTPASAGDLDTKLHLAPHASEEFQVGGTISPFFQGTLTNTARVDPPAGLVDDHPENNEATVKTEIVWPPGFQLFCTGVDGPFAELDTITCVFVLLNGGPFAQADNPGDEFTVTLPAGLTLVSASASSGTTATFANTATWNGGIPVGGRVDITVKATVNAGTAGTTICIQGSAFLDTDGDGVNDTVFLSDDIHSPCPPPDPCCFRVLTPPEIPALSQVGMVLLALLLAAGAMVRLRARRAS